MILIKIILVILCVIVGLRVFGYLALRYLAYKLKKTFENRQPQNFKTAKEGEITIQMPEKQNKNHNDINEFTDYEEVK